MASKTRLSIFRMDGGMNTQDKPWLLPKNQAQSLRNYDLEKTGYVGILSKRNGYAKYNSTEIASSAGVNSIYKYIKADGTSYFVCSSGTDVYKAVASQFNGNGIGATLTTDKLVKFKTFTNILCFCNETDAPKSWNGTAVSSLTGAPSGAYYIEVFRNRLWLARTATYPSRLYYSALLNANDWATAQNAGYVDINTDDGDYITGIKTQGDRLIIFKRHSIYVMTGTEPDNFYWKLLWSDVGCVASLSIANIEETIFFLADDAVYSFNSTSASPVLMSRAIKPTIDSITNKTTCAGGIYKNQYWLSYYITGSSTNDRALVLNYRKGAWAEYWGIKAGCFYLDEDTNTFYAGSPTAGFVYTLDSGTADVTDKIVTYYKSPAFEMDTPEVDKQFEKIYTVALRAGSATTTKATFSFDYWIDFVSASDTRILDFSALSGATIKTDRQNFEQGSVGKFLELAYFNSSSNTINLYGYTVYDSILEPR